MIIFHLCVISAHCNIFSIPTKTLSQHQFYPTDNPTETEAVIFLLLTRVKLAEV